MRKMLLIGAAALSLSGCHPDELMELVKNPFSTVSTSHEDHNHDAHVHEETEKVEPVPPAIASSAAVEMKTPKMDVPPVVRKTGLTQTMLAVTLARRAAVKCGVFILKGEDKQTYDENIDEVKRITLFTLKNAEPAYTLDQHYTSMMARVERYERHFDSQVDHLGCDHPRISESILLHRRMFTLGVPDITINVLERDNH